MGFENFKAIAKISIGRGVATLLFCIPLTYLWGLEGAIVGLVIVAAIALVYFSIVLKRNQINARFPDNIPLRELIQETPVLWKFALPSLMTGILIASVMWVGRILLTQGEFGYTEVGIFEAANQWRTLILFLPAAISRVTLPILSETYGKESKQEFNTVVSIQVQAVCLITLPLVVCAVGFSKPLSTVFGSQFGDTEFVIPILMLSVFFSAMNESMRRVFDGAGKRWTNFAIYLLWTLVFFLGCFEFIPKMGAIGFALAHLGAEALILLIQACYVDVVLAPATLRKHSRFFLFSLVLLGCSYIVQGNISEGWDALIIGGLFTIGVLVAFLKLKAMARQT